MFGTPRPRSSICARSCALLASALLAVQGLACRVPPPELERSYGADPPSVHAPGLRMRLHAVRYAGPSLSIRIALTHVDDRDLDAAPVEEAPVHCVLLVDDLAYFPASPVALDAPPGGWRLDFDLPRPLRDEARLRCHDLPASIGPRSLELRIAPTPSVDDPRLGP